MSSEIPANPGDARRRTGHADGVPPWIAHRTEDSDVATDTAQRQRFYQWLDESIFMAVDRFRTERQRLN